MRVFYDANIKKGTKEFTLTEEESKHIVKVLRLKIGDELILLNGLGGRFECKIMDAHPKRCTVEIVHSIFEERADTDIHIAIAPTKQMDRIEWFVEKATEIGVTHVTLIHSKNAERNKINLERLQKKAISAMKQSQRTFLPGIDDLMDVKDFIHKYPVGLIAHCEEDDKKTISETWKKNNFPILIGPEGDFTNEEIELIKESGYLPVSLGENRLRTETAGIYAVLEAKLARR